MGLTMETELIFFVGLDGKVDVSLFHYRLSYLNELLPM